jgi:IS30 family transposase
VVTFGHRQVLEHLWGQGCRFAQIARLTGLPVCTVSREVARNGSPFVLRGTWNPLGRSVAPGRGPVVYRWAYDAVMAQERARGRLPRPRVAKVVGSWRLRGLVLAKLRRRWSPAQIAGWLTVRFPDRPELHVSHETIYQAIYVQARGGLRAELKRLVADERAEALRSGRARRRPQSQQARSGRS